jgi:large subunit ribosomal protein L31
MDPRGKKVTTLKENIHPDYQPTTITCSCGEVIQTASTRKDIKVEICSKCHPFYTGVQRFVDAGGRVERFKRKYGMQ